MDQRVRRATGSDVDRMVELVHELAEYEQAPEKCHLTAEQLRTALFGPSPALFAHVAELDGEVVGVALWFLNFSTWDSCLQTETTACDHPPRSSVTISARKVAALVGSAPADERATSKLRGVLHA